MVVAAEVGLAGDVWVICMSSREVPTIVDVFPRLRA